MLQANSSKRIQKEYTNLTHVPFKLAGKSWQSLPIFLTVHLYLLRCLALAAF
jgi:hypothetical protein